MAKPLRTKASEITHKEKQVADNYLTNGFRKKKAILDSSYDVSEPRASTLAKDVLSRPAVKSYVEEVLSTNNLSIEELARLSKRSIDINMEQGKGSQAVAASMIQFMYKLHNAVPATKTLKASLNIGVKMPQLSYNELKKELIVIHENTTKLLEDLKK